MPFPNFARPTEAFAELYGPVITDASSTLSLGATLGSNNTGELSAIGEALLWLRDEAPPGAAAIYYDSEPLGVRHRPSLDTT